MHKVQQVLQIPTLPPLHSISKKSVSVFQSGQNLVDLQSYFTDQIDTNSSQLLLTSRQINSGMMLDMKQYDKSSKMKKHFILKDGEKDEKNGFFIHDIKIRQSVSFRSDLSMNEERKLTKQERQKYFYQGGRTYKQRKHEWKKKIWKQKVYYYTNNALCN